MHGSNELRRLYVQYNMLTASHENGAKTLFKLKAFVVNICVCVCIYIYMVMNAVAVRSEVSHMRTVFRY
jgi:hypothetical protein